MRMSIRLVSMTVALMLAGGPLASFGQKAADRIDYTRMRQDLDIMETILNKLISVNLRQAGSVRLSTRGEAVVGWFGSGPSVGSVYLDDFGVIFDVRYPRSLLFSRSLKYQKKLLAEFEEEARLLRLQAERAEAHGTITGRIVDKRTGEPIKNAYVSVNGQSAYTDSRGRFSIEDVEPGSYTLVAVAPGYEQTSRKNVVVKQGQPVSVALNLSRDKSVERLKSQLVKFLGNYADAIGQISPDQWIMVMVNFSGNTPMVSVPALLAEATAGETGGMNRLVARVKKRDIVEYRRGSIDLSTFRKRVKFEEPGPSAEDTDLDIFVEIMKTVVEKRFGSSSLAAEDLQGFYVDDRGAVIMLRARPGFWIVAPEVSSILSKGKRGETTITVARAPRAARGRSAKAREEDARRGKEALEKYKKQVVEILADFGHTLRRIGPDGWIVVVSDIQPDWVSSERQRLVCKVRKRDIAAYNRRTIDLAAFSKRVVWREF